MFVKALAFSDQRKSKVREGREISTCAYAALGRNERRDSAVQEFADRVDDRRPHAGVAFRKRVGSQQHHSARLGNRKRLTNSDGMGANEIDLQLANLVGRDAHVT